MVAKALTDNQELFCREYQKDRNSAGAYRRAYPDCKSGWNAHGARLIAKDSIKARIKELMAELGEKIQWDALESERKLQETYDFAKFCKQPPAMVSAVTALNKLKGFDKEPAKSEEPDKLSPEDIDTLRAMAKTITDKGLSGPVLSVSEFKPKDGAGGQPNVKTA